MDYDKQAILVLRYGSNDTITRMGRDLYNKHPSKSILLQVTNGNGIVLQGGYSNLTGNSRLYIVGHGTYDGTTVGDMTGEQVADSLVNNLKLAAIKKISVVSCYAAGTSEEMPQSNHFATQLHAHLGQKYSINCVVTARRTLVTTARNGKKFTHPNGATFNSPSTNKRPQSKIEIFWQGREQRWRYAY